MKETATKENFYAEYRVELVNRYAWAQEAGRLDRFMTSVRTTLETSEAPWNHEGEAVTAVWRKIGGKGKPTRKALRALPQWPSA